MTSIKLLGLSLFIVAQFVLVGCSRETLVQAREGYSTTLVRKTKVDEPPETPPLSSGLKLVSYKGPLGDMAAYVGRIPTDGKRHPAILWLVGGFSNSIGGIAWTPGPDNNDQSASAFREAGVVMLYPSLRGGNTNPGYREAFAGEANDVLAAAAFLRSQDYVDPTRIYLAGHSTGGTLALLVAELPNPFRAIFCLGPVDNVAGYGGEVLPFDLSNRKEIRIRSPLYWLQEVKTKTFVLEGATGRSNIESVRNLQRANQNPMITFIPVEGRDHFSLIKPFVRELTKQITADTGPVCTISFQASSL